ncbi:MAG: metallophosphoesterase [Desulfobacterales bacterium]
MPKRKRITRGKLLAGVGIFALVIFLALLAYGVAIEPDWLEETKIGEYTIPHLPSAWEGRKIACISDFQLGMWLDNEDAVRDAVDSIVSKKPSLAVILGDFIYHTEDDHDDIRRAVEILRPLTAAGIPTYAVLGNHDYSLEEPGDEPNREKAAFLETMLQENGVTVLHNQAVSLGADPSLGGTQAPGAPSSPEGNAMPLYLVGIGSHWMGLDRPDKAFAQLPAEAPRLVIMHNPDSFGLLPPGSAPVALAGHTHGGQIRVPGFPEWSWLTFVKEDEVHAGGWISGYGEPGNHLYVNRGIGFSTVPIRINCRPELTWITLHAQRGRNE